MVKICFYTLFIAICSTLVAAFVGTGASFFVAKRNFFGRKLLLSFSAVPLCVPPLIIALGYVGFFGLNGRLNLFLKSFINLSESPIRFLYSSLGIIIAQGFYNFPFVMAIVAETWEELDPIYENQARLLGASEFRIFFKITFPRLKSAVASGIIPVFLFCFFSFLIALLFSKPGVSTLEVEIYRAAKITLDINLAVRLVVLETCIALFVVFGSTAFLKNSKKNFGTSANFFADKRKPKIGRADFQTKSQSAAEIFLWIFLLILILFFFLLPFFDIIATSFSSRKGGVNEFSFEQFKWIFSSPRFYNSLKNTIVVSFFTSIFCCLIGFVFASTVRIFKKSDSLIFQAIPMIPLAISSVAISWIITLVVKRPNPFFLILCECFIYWPIAYRQIQNGFNKISIDSERSSILLTHSKLKTTVRLFMPANRRAILSAFFYCFAVSAGDTTIPLILGIPKFDTLAIFTYRLCSTYKYLQASASATILTLICILCFWGSRCISKR